MRVVLIAEYLVIKNEYQGGLKTWRAGRCAAALGTVLTRKFTQQRRQKKKKDCESRTSSLISLKLRKDVTHKFRTGSSRRFFSLCISPFHTQQTMNRVEPWMSGEKYFSYCSVGANEIVF